MSDLFSMDELLQRFAISALSKERKDEAVNEEILVGKYTGEFFIKSKDGVVISTDILNRLSNAIENATDIAESIGMVGDLIKLDFDNIPMPTHVDYNINLIEQEPVVIKGNCKKLLMNFDYDEYDVIGDSIKLVSSENNIQVSLNLVKANGFIEEVVIEKSIQVINNFIINIEEYGFGDLQSIEIKGITINKDEAIFNNNANDRNIILHNLFVVVNK